MEGERSIEGYEIDGGLEIDERLMFVSVCALWVSYICDVLVKNGYFEINSSPWLKDYFYI